MHFDIAIFRSFRYNKAYTDRKMLYREPKQEEIEALRARMQKIKDDRNSMLKITFFLIL